MHASQEENIRFKVQPVQSQTNRDAISFGAGGDSLQGARGLNFTRFADSRKGGGNAMGKGGGSRVREWDILTVTYMQQAEQSRGGSQSIVYSLSEQILIHLWRPGWELTRRQGCCGVVACLLV